MDLPTSSAGHSGLDPHAGEPAARPRRKYPSAPEISGGPGGTPPRLIAQAASSAAPGPLVPARAAPGAGAPLRPALDVDIESLVTEDDEPVDNILSEKHNASSPSR